MRYFFCFILFFYFCAPLLRAQSPELIPYQAIVRDAFGDPMSQSNVTLTFNIIQDDFNGLVVYTESHAVTTDNRGYVNVNIGAGNVLLGNFSSIDWANHEHYMRVLLNGVEIGNQKLLSVPYALHSRTADKIPFRVSTSGDTLFMGVDGYLIVPGITDANYTPGCTDPTACNYSVEANLEDGSCLQVYDICDDGDPLTINDAINTSCGCQGFLTGATLLPGNGSCSSSPISVSGCAGQTELEYQGEVYSLTEIGGQCWFAENLSSSKYRDGSNIPNLTTNASWVATTSGAYCTYANVAANGTTYGKLYNWFTVNDSRGICPLGWHAPSDCDWMFLENSLGLSTASQTSTGGRGTTQGGKLKATTLWAAPNTGATNEFLFTALPGGYRNQSGSFRVITNGAYFWSSSSANATTAYFRSLLSTTGSIFRSTSVNAMGMGVRCVKD